MKFPAVVAIHTATNIETRLAHNQEEYDALINSIMEKVEVTGYAVFDIVKTVWRKTEWQERDV